jgi:hypothetical protein
MNVQSLQMRVKRLEDIISNIPDKIFDSENTGVDFNKEFDV